MAILTSIAALALALMAQVDATPARVPLAPSLEVWLDADGGADLPRALEHSADFRPHSRVGIPNFGFGPEQVWARLALANPGSQPLRRWLDFDQAVVDRATVWQRRDGVVVSQSVQGRDLPIALRTLPRPTYAFAVDLPPHSRTELYVHVASQNERHLPLTLYDHIELTRHDLGRSGALGLLLGILLVMALYNLVLYAMVRSRAHLAYAAYVLAMVWWLSLLDGSLPLVFGLDAPPGRWAYALPATLAFASATVFARDILELDSSNPRLAKIMRFLGVLCATTPLLLPLMSWLQFNQWAGAMIPLILVASMTAGVVRVRQGHRPARLFTLGYSLFFVATLLMALTTNGVLPWHASPLLLHMGVAGEALVFSVALAQATRDKNLAIERLHQAGRRFVPFEFLRLLGRPSLPEVAASDRIEREMTVLFADLRGFTTLSEHLAPAEVMALVNAFNAAVEPAIRAHGGFVDKFIGDAVMALFDRPEQAVAAAVQACADLRAHNTKAVPAGKPALTAGFGIHCGRLVLGTVGSPERLSCTVLGDSVNLASRVEGLSKVYGATVLVTEAVAQNLSNTALRQVDRAAVRGKLEATGLFEVLDALDPAVRDLRQATLAEFEAARLAYVAGEFAQAAEGFASVLRQCDAAGGDDAAARFLREQSLAQLAAPQEGWDGVTRHAVK
ncbi:MAG: hypothetical protein HY902_00400 [Deltaproteobacteria bacterium]|nr:hypothetical protein [Deltaproteobacteria bacterium]